MRNSSNVTQAYVSGGDDFLPKPFTVEDTKKRRLPYSVSPRSLVLAL
jgi:hypothetical protein